MTLQTYKCHKTVKAAKITGIECMLDTEYCLWFDDADHVVVNDFYISRNEPQTGGYYVKYDDGYESYSPADVFEAGYSLETD